MKDSNMQLNSCHGKREARQKRPANKRRFGIAPPGHLLRALSRAVVALQPSPCHLVSTRLLCNCTPGLHARLQQKMKLFLLILSVGLVSLLITANNIDKLDPCILSCLVKSLQDFGCKGNVDEIVICGCKIITQYQVGSVIAGCTEDACNIKYWYWPEVLKDTQKCSDAFGSPTGSPDRTLSRFIPTVGISTSSRLSSSTVSSDGISWTSTPTPTPTPTSTSTSTTPPRSGLSETPDASRVSPSTGAMIHTLASSMTSNAPIDNHTGGLTTSASTASPTPPSNGPELSPAIITSIVISTVTVIGVPLWLLRCYRWRKSQATSSTEGDIPPVPAEKGIQSVVTGYNELLGSTEMRHELSNTPVELPLYINTIVEIDSNPLRKTPEVSPEDESRDDAISQAVSFSATTAVSCPEPQQVAKEEEETTNTEVPEEDCPRAEEETETELEVLQGRQRELERKRHYLEQIQEIDEEEARLQQRIDELQLQSHGPR